MIATISDRKIGVDYDASMDYFTAEVMNATDYYAFGMPMPGRNFTSSGYRYGFNGKENDPETVGTGSGTQDYGMRIYNPALGKFLSVDPLFKEYPHSSVYAFAENGPIENIDRDGEERRHYSIIEYEKNGKAILKFEREESLKERKFDWSTFKWKTVVNGRVEYVIHSGVFHEGLINSTKYSTEIAFTYNGGSDFVKNGTTLNKSDVDRKAHFYYLLDKLIQGGMNVGKVEEDKLFPDNNVIEYHRKAKTKGFDVPLKANGAPNFSGFLAPVGVNQKNQLSIVYTGSYPKDFAQADKLAGFTKENPRPENTTWHHVEDYNAHNNIGTMQLVPKDVHDAARHPGGAAQYREAKGSGY